MTAIRIILGIFVGLLVLAMTGVLSFLSPVFEGIYEATYHQPMPHRNGDAIDRLNDWLNFLPSDPAVRFAIVAGFVIGILLLTLIFNLFSLRLKRIRQARRAREDARMRAINSYHTTNTTNR